MRFREDEREAIVEARKSIRLSSQSLMQKVVEAKKVQPEVMKATSEYLERNNIFIKTFLDMPKNEPITEYRDRLPPGWRIRQ